MLVFTRRRGQVFRPSLQLNREVVLFLLYGAVFHIGLFGIPDVVLNFYFVSLGYNSETIGVLQSLSRISGLLTGLPVGYLANRIGERRIIFVSTFGVAFTLLLMVAIPSQASIAAARFLLGFFYGAGQIATAPLMVKLVNKGSSTHFFAYHNIVSMGATALGSLIGGYLPAVLVGAAAGSIAAQSSAAYGAALVACAVIIIISALPLLGVREHRNPAPAPSADGTPAPRKRLPWRLMLVLSLPMILFGFSGGLTFPFYNLFFRETFASSDEIVGTILSYGWLGMALIPMLNPVWDRRFGKALSLGLLMTVASVAFFLLSRADQLSAAIIYYVIAVSLRNCMQPLYQPLLMETLPAELHNLASSTGLVLWNIGWFCATTLSGFWINQYGYGFIMQIVAVVVFFSGWGVVLAFRKKPTFAAA